MLASSIPHWRPRFCPQADRRTVWESRHEPGRRRPSRRHRVVPWAPASPPRGRPPPGGLRGKDHRGPQLQRGAETAPDQQPAAPCRVDRCRPRYPAPVLPPHSLRAFAGPQASPPILGQGGQQGCHVPLLPVHPDIYFAGDGQPRGLGLALQPQPPAPIITIDAGAGAPRGGRRLGRTAPVIREAGRQRSRSFVHAWGC